MFAVQSRQCCWAWCYRAKWICWSYGVGRILLLNIRAMCSNKLFGTRQSVCPTLADNEQRSVVAVWDGELAVPRHRGPILPQSATTAISIFVRRRLNLVTRHSSCAVDFSVATVESYQQQSVEIPISDFIWKLRLNANYTSLDSDKLLLCSQDESYTERLRAVPQERLSPRFQRK